jgi:hypothetical protein
LCFPDGGLDIPDVHIYGADSGRTDGLKPVLSRPSAQLHSRQQNHSRHVSTTASSNQQSRTHTVARREGPGLASQIDRLRGMNPGA